MAAPHQLQHDSTEAIFYVGEQDQTVVCFIACDDLKPAKGTYLVNVL